MAERQHPFYPCVIPASKDRPNDFHVLLRHRPRSYRAGTALLFPPVSAVMYSTGLCPYCFLARKLLERHGIEYEERRMRRADRALLAPLGGGLTFPQIEINGRVVNGFSELRRLERDGKLDWLSAGR